MFNSANVRNSAATVAVAADSGSDIDDADAVQSEIEADLLESVYVYLMEGRYQEGMSANQKRVIRKKARIENREMISKKCRGKDKVLYIAIHLTILKTSS